MSFSDNRGTFAAHARQRGDRMSPTTTLHIGLALGALGYIVALAAIFLDVRR